MRCCSMILPSMSQIREGKEFSQLTNGVSGVSVVLRVGLLCRLKELREADGDHQGVTLSALVEGLREDGRCCFPVLISVCGVSSVSYIHPTVPTNRGA